MSEEPQDPEGDDELLRLSKKLTEAVVEGDVRSARAAGEAIGRGLEAVREEPSKLIVLADERKRRQSRSRRRARKK